MKKILRYVLLLLLVCFSFFYTDRVMSLINKKDPLMKKLDSVKEEYRIEPVSATIEDNTIIPGKCGREIDIDKSYEEMKLEGIFRENSLVYKDLMPSSSLSNNKDKFIIKGSDIKSEVAILLIVDSNNDVDNLSNFSNLSLFVNSNYINSKNIDRLKKNEIYTYGKNGIYTKEYLISDNAIIDSLSNNKSLYCLAKDKNNETLEVCNERGMFVVIPNIVGDYHNVKSSLSNGSIILLNSVNNIDLINKYIIGKGYNLVTLSKLLEE